MRLRCGKSFGAPAHCHAFEVSLSIRMNMHPRPVDFKNIFFWQAQRRPSVATNGSQAPTAARGAVPPTCGLPPVQPGRDLAIGQQWPRRLHDDPTLPPPATPPPEPRPSRAVTVPGCSATGQGPLSSPSPHSPPPLPGHNAGFAPPPSGPRRHTPPGVGARDTGTAAPNFSTATPPKHPNPRGCAGALLSLPALPSAPPPPRPPYQRTPLVLQLTGVIR